MGIGCLAYFEFNKSQDPRGFGVFKGLDFLFNEVEAVGSHFVDKFLNDGSCAVLCLRAAHD